MRITPLDIQQKQFSSRLKGFDMEEVDSFLELIREEMEELLRENANLREETKRFEKQLKEIEKFSDLEHKKIPDHFDFTALFVFA